MGGRQGRQREQRRQQHAGQEKPASPLFVCQLDRRQQQQPNANGWATTTEPRGAVTTASIDGGGCGCCIRPCPCLTGICCMRPLRRSSALVSCRPKCQAAARRREGICAQRAEAAYFSMITRAARFTVFVRTPEGRQRGARSALREKLVWTWRPWLQSFGKRRMRSIVHARVQDPAA